MEQKKDRPLNDHIFEVSIGVIAFLLGLVVNIFSLTDRIATRQYVDLKLEESKRYIDSSILEAKQYSDLNRKSVQAELQASISDVKSDIKAVLVKQDLMYDMMKTRKKE